MHKGGIILVSDQQLQDLQDPDKVVDLSLSNTPNPTTLRKICEQTKAAVGRTVILAFDEFWTQFSSGYKDAVAFVILLTLLFVRPSGLFGRRGAERV